MPHRHAPRPAALSHLRPTDAGGAMVITLAAAATALAIWLSASGGWPRWALGQLLLGFSLVHWFVVLHECGHDTLFRTRRLNAAAGTVAGFFSVIPFRCWRRVHGRHHKWTGWQDLDPTTAALVPRELSRGERTIVNVCWRLWVPLFSILYRVENFWNLPRLFRLFPRRADRLAMVRDTAAIVGAMVALVSVFGAGLVVRAGGAGLLLSLAIEDLLLLSQHTHIPQHVSGGAPVEPFATIDQGEFTRSLRLPRWASALLLHFDAHELHHMYPFVPGYLLQHVDCPTENEIGWWAWVRGAKQLRGDVLLFQNRSQTGWEI